MNSMHPLSENLVRTGAMSPMADPCVDIERGRLRLCGIRVPARVTEALMSRVGEVAQRRARGCAEEARDGHLGSMLCCAAMAVARGGRHRPRFGPDIVDAGWESTGIRVVVEPDEEGGTRWTIGLAGEFGAAACALVRP